MTAMRKDCSIYDGKSIDANGIDNAFQLIDLPVFVVSRHGRHKKCFSRDTAINRLAHFMTERVFFRAGLSSRQPDIRIYRDGEKVWTGGEVLPRYLTAHKRCERRIRRLLAKKNKQKRDAERWNKKFSSWAAKHEVLLEQKKESEKIYNQLMKERPF
ncbi:hypothetical protein R9X49_15620 [Pectobacterium carotovorum]|uniref:hypothetical protein n=1 Tax=Pectobacterium carotovorum TaxID=554 RepID=UPI0029D52F47|nr:hypothetical protein [Pectobacterium carotovorum]MDX6916538.1 hypothetical protein [Pectobacterium carotovorum]